MRRGPVRERGASSCPKCECGGRESRTHLNLRGCNARGAHMTAMIPGCARGPSRRPIAACGLAAATAALRTVPGPSHRHPPPPPLPPPRTLPPAGQGAQGGGAARRWVAGVTGGGGWAAAYEPRGVSRRVKVNGHASESSGSISGSESSTEPDEDTESESVSVMLLPPPPLLPRSAHAALPTAGMVSVGPPAPARLSGPRHVALLLALSLVLAGAGTVAPWYKVIIDIGEPYTLYSMVYRPELSFVVIRNGALTPMGSLVDSTRSPGALLSSGRGARCSLSLQARHSAAPFLGAASAPPARPPWPPAAALPFSSSGWPLATPALQSC